MSIIREKDLELFNDNIDKIQDEVKKRTWNLLEPTGDFKMEVVNKVLEYVKKNKRKIYGSYSHNKIVMHKNKKDGFLSELDVPDIDFYSPDPLKDLYDICNMFHERGFKNIVGREAQHAETYKIWVDDAEACDISYVPRNVYNKIPYIEIDGTYYVHANWSMIDYLRILTDPMTSWEIKLDKRFKRFYLLQKHYSLPTTDKLLDLEIKNKDKSQSILNKLFKFAINKRTILTTGLYAYNYFLLESNKSDKYTDIPFYEFISTNYVEDGKELVKYLKEYIPEDLKFEEHYPYFQFTDFNLRIYYKEQLICILYGNNKKCLPYNKVKAIYFEKNKKEKQEGEINLVSFNLLLLNSLVSHMLYRTQEDNKNKDLYMNLISNIIKFRNYYLDKNNKNIFDAGIFSDFIIECTGETVSARKEFNERIKENKEKGRNIIFQYRPEQGVKEESHDFQFKNSSGNKINNEKNLLIIS